MVAWGYEISFLLLKNISQVSAAKEWNIIHHFHISARPSNTFYLLAKANYCRVKLFLSSSLPYLRLFTAF